MLNGDEDVTDSYSYEAFGNVLSDGGPTPNPYRYVGSLGYYQTGSSLMHLGARYYLPEIGRFLAEDPLGADHPYAYCGSNPVGWADPEGLSIFGSTIDYYAAEIFNVGLTDYYRCWLGCMTIGFDPADGLCPDAVKGVAEALAFEAAKRQGKEIARRYWCHMYPKVPGLRRWGSAAFKTSKKMVPKLAGAISLVITGVEAQVCEGKCSGKALHGGRIP